MGRQKYEFRGPKRKERPRKDWVFNSVKYVCMYVCMYV
jgi:hypothetical protein